MGPAPCVLIVRDVRIGRPYCALAYGARRRDQGGYCHGAASGRLKVDPSLARGSAIVAAGAQKLGMP